MANPIFKGVEDLPPPRTAAFSAAPTTASSRFAVVVEKKKGEVGADWVGSAVERTALSDVKWEQLKAKVSIIK